MLQFECCGVNNYTDYYNNAFPASCCPPDVGTSDIKTLVNTLWKDSLTTYTVQVAACADGSNSSYITGIPVRWTLHSMRIL